MAKERWQGDEHFVEWLISREYAYRDKKGYPQPHGSEGVVIYMWEAWKGARGEDDVPPTR